MGVCCVCESHFVAVVVERVATHCTRMYCYSSINLSQLLAAWAQRLPTLLKLAIGLAGYRVGFLVVWFFFSISPS